MRLQQFVATLVSILVLGVGASAAFDSPAHARGGKKEAGGEMPASMSQQFQWEDKVVGPKEGLNKDKVAATRERGLREEQERKNKPPEKTKKVVTTPRRRRCRRWTSRSRPRRPRRSRRRSPPRPRASATRSTTCSTSRGSSPNNPSGGSSGLDSVFASDDKSCAKRQEGRQEDAPRRN